jgi:hypothetical protein
LLFGRPKVDQGRLRELEREVDNMVNAIASGALRGSPALAARLAAAESELSKLKEPAPDRAPIERLIPRIGERYLATVKELKTAERDPQRARMALFEALEEPITLHPENGVLVAEIAYRAPLPLVGNVSENMVAGNRY